MAGLGGGGSAKEAARAGLCGKALWSTPIASSGSAGAGGRFAEVGKEEGRGEATEGREEGQGRRRQFVFLLHDRSPPPPPPLPFSLSDKLNGTVD
jgi:hypothetical protein